MKREPRFPFAPLAAVCSTRWRPECEGQAISVSDVGKVAAVAGVSANTAQRWRTVGLTERAADMAAVELGLHPGMIWPEWWEVAC